MVEGPVKVEPFGEFGVEGDEAVLCNLK